MTLAQLKSKCKYWQKALMLNDWVITVQWADADEISGCWGVCGMNSDAQHAEIKMLRGQAYPEYWLIHELGHVVMAGISTDAPTTLEERAINRYTRLIAELAGVPSPARPWSEE